MTTGTFNPDDRAANMNLLDDGTLYVAKFAEDGTLAWLPLVHGEGPLTAANGFESQADVLIETRLAADLLGATKMDRPEDIEPNPVNGKVYVMLTNNTRRKAEQVDAANPRAENAFGHIIEIAEADGDFTATSGKWEVLLKCGDPSVAEVGATFSTATTAERLVRHAGQLRHRRRRPAVGLDRRPGPEGDRPHRRPLGGRYGRRGARHVEALLPRAGRRGDVRPAVHAGHGRRMFVAVQHPADGGDDWEAFGRPSYYEDPSTRWPDFQDGMPTRPSVVVITKQGGGKIAS